MKRVIIASPLSGDREKHKFYARLCMRDCLERGEAPYASHLLFDHVDLLDDDKPEERAVGMGAGFVWLAQAQLVVVYGDLGISKGMHADIAQATLLDIPSKYRWLPTHLLARFHARYPVAPTHVRAVLPEERCPECTAVLPFENAVSCFHCGWVRAKGA